MRCQKKYLRTTLLLMAILLVGFTLSACGTSQTTGTDGTTAPTSQQTPTNGAEKSFKIGVTQIVSHPALDGARQGFVDALKANGFEEGKNVTYDFQNAEGSQDTAKSIADKFVSNKVDLILAIATPTAQAAAQTTKDIPIVITAVTDPVSAGLVASMEKPGGNVTGTTDMNPVKEQLQLVTRLTTGKRLGILYNSGESNSEVQVKMAQDAAKELGLTVELSAVTNSSEVKAAAESLSSKVDAFYVPTDNTVVSALEAVIGVAEAKKIPLVVGEGDSVKRGGLITYGIDYYQLGYQTGEMAVKILKGEAKPADMPVESQKNLKLYVNETEAKKVGIEIPQDLLDKADEKY
ncbi:ABC-type uncharacterized transport system,periplasmic component [[Clostridium] ultunense Esp]|uniref:ABC transporter substrate-binding protein n=1 Tax=Thermicanus aegyptius TaxID=94009 RepID=UPI0002B7002E|nr:ABC transporter substrate-binding protein [Thermicanus aegyptius]CCQ92245.1 ABC-type uncharacterized transport system,periplasmic component [[Clostridium] ultunense Esp]